MDPRDHLVYPSDAVVIPDLASGIISSMGTLTSPTAIVRTIVDQAFDFDPLAEVTKYFAGDWGGVAQMSRAYEHVVDYIDECAKALRDEVDAARLDWSGQAAIAAEAYATEALAPALNELATNIRTVAGQCSSVSAGMQQTAALANDAINMVIDLIVLWAASIAAAAATSWSGIGAVAGGAVAAGVTAKIISTVRMLNTYFGAAQALLDASSGLIPGYLGALKGFESVPIPQLSTQGR